MMTPLAVLLLAAAGTASLYLASPHQRWRATPLRARPARAAGAVLLAASFGLLVRTMMLCAAIFTFSTCLMLLLTLAPYIGTARRTGAR